MTGEISIPPRLGRIERMGRSAGSVSRQSMSAMASTKRLLVLTTLNAMTVIPRKSAFEQLSRREYALLACGLGGVVLAFLPVLLHRFGTRWRPGVPRLETETGASAGPTRTRMAPAVRE